VKIGLGGVYTQTKDRYRNVLGVTDEIEGKYNAVRQIKELKRAFQIYQVTNEIKP